jgi:hypothetical protein
VKRVVLLLCVRNLKGLDKSLFENEPF